MIYDLRFMIGVPHFDKIINHLVNQNDMTQQQVLDLYFLDARHKLIEVAAFLDRAGTRRRQGRFPIESLSRRAG